MTDRDQFFYSNYSHFNDQVLGAVRRETFGEDIGQNSWITVEEYDRFLDWLGPVRDRHVLEVACGSGGPALYLAQVAGCRVTGIDVNESGVATAREMAMKSGKGDRVQFQVADANQPLPFDDSAFDALVCIDSMNHFASRLAVFREWYRVLRPGGRAVFTDPVVVTGPVTNDELARRSSIGFFLFVPPGVNEKLLEEAGLALVRREDVTENAALVSQRWYQARSNHRGELLQFEGEQAFEESQRFFDAVYRLTSERRLSRILYIAEKRAT